MNGMKTVMFSLNNQLCGADISQVSDVIRWQSINKLPKQPKFMAGIIGLRGRVIPVIDLNARFELGETELTKKTKIVITQVEGSPVGYIVNDVLEILDFAEEDIEPAPGILNSDSHSYLRSIGKKADKLVSILDLTAILTDKELKRLAEVK
jgi:purine-binding chemotaxis protein CheW